MALGLRGTWSMTSPNKINAAKNECVQRFKDYGKFSAFLILVKLRKLRLLIDISFCLS